jgi:hypothetical protein
MSTSITMTTEQTAIYDCGDERAMRELMDGLRRQAREILARTERPVEIYTADGAVAEVVQ